MKDDISISALQGNSAICRLATEDEKQDMTNIQQDSQVDRQRMGEINLGFGDLFSHVYEVVLDDDVGLGGQGGG